MAKTATSAAKKKKLPAKAAAPSKKGGTKANAADALLKLLESPLVVDLLAVGATAALAALTEQRYSSRTGKGAGAKRALKGAVTAAAGAMGRRIATEFDEIKKASKAKSAKAG